MELRQLRYFIAVAEELSFTRAATRLHIAQPSLSQQIQALEQELTVSLLERSKRHVQLTTAGVAFLEEARLTLKYADLALKSARAAAGRVASLSIGFVPAAEVRIFPLVLPQLRMNFPNLNIELHSLPTPHLETALREHQVDLAFMRGPVSEDLQSEIVLNEPFLAVLPLGHPLCELESIPVSALANENFVGMNPEYAGDHMCKVVADWGDQNGLTCDHIHRASNVLLDINLVGMGLGYSILPAYVTEIASRSVCCRPFDEPAPTIDLLAVTRSGARSEQLNTLLTLARNASFEHCHAN
ncbi:LysR substrate-binding domain-containing protein [Paraburkholderia adhaesiva]|uniref:LysR substrate-binding domain-containing protein n=1 Tax=Paraburkholderia adhaesiva TaxID=2883244 RepID=UPI001F25AE62|nr:LysR substrate-binding domain-containing protein [Paraburkholderia adhaesiva]